MGAIVPGSFAAGRLDFALKRQSRVKRRRNDLKLDVQPFGSMLRSRANQSTKFLIFGKVEDFVADFPPRVETRSNDVRMT